MTHEEVAAMYQKIELLIGKREDVKSMNGRMEYDKMRERLLKLIREQGEKALSLKMVVDLGCTKFITPSGKKAIWEPNNGMEQRSRYCGALSIDGKTIFTSGTIAKVYEYLLKN